MLLYFNKLTLSKEKNYKSYEFLFTLQELSLSIYKDNRKDSV